MATYYLIISTVIMIIIIIITVKKKKTCNIDLNKINLNFASCTHL